MKKTSKNSSIDGMIHVCIVQNDQRIIAAQFQSYSFEMPSTFFGKFTPDPGRTGKADPLDPPVLNKEIANFAASAIAMGYDIEHALGKPASSNSSAKRMPPLTGDSSDGFSTTVLP
jgi:hypothetical protein